MNPNIIILAIHQSHVGAKAGGYIRLQEFLKYTPEHVKSIVIDISPSIYKEDIRHNQLVTVVLPKWIRFLVRHFFVVGVLFERIFTSIECYRLGVRYIQKYNIPVIYIPMGDLPQLYLPAIFLKRKFPQVKLVVDILNFEIYDKGIIPTIKAFQKNSKNIFVSFILACVVYISYLIIKYTINSVDYIFSVSPTLVERIKKVYKHETISYTPSGVSKMAFGEKKKQSKYLGIYVGRVTELKGIYNLLDVWTALVRKIPDAKLAIVGLISEVELKIVKKIINERKLESNILVTGGVSEETKFKYISQSNIFLHLATYEPLFPVIGILEGCAMGLPVICYDMKVIPPPQEISKEKSLIIVKNGAIDEVVSSIMKLRNLSNNDIEKIQEKAKNYAKKYDWEQIAKIEYNILSKYARVK